MDHQQQLFNKVFWFQTCEKVRAFALKVHGKPTDTALAVKEAIIQGAQTAQETYQKAVDFLKAKISCENVLSMDVSGSIIFNIN